jgi:hypothetical protein
MALLATNSLDDKIREAAIAAYGCVDATIDRYTVTERGAKFDSSGVWFALHIRQTADSPWEAIGRRRTLSELLTLARRGPLRKA